MYVYIYIYGSVSCVLYLVGTKPPVSLFRVLLMTWFRAKLAAEHEWDPPLRSRFASKHQASPNELRCDLFFVSRLAVILSYVSSSKPVICDCSSASTLVLALLQSQLDRCGPADLHVVPPTVGYSLGSLLLCCILCAGAGSVVGATCYYCRREKTTLD